MNDVVAAVDVGTESARAGVFDRSGALLGRGEHRIRLERSAPRFAEHGSEDIWAAIGQALRAARERAGVAADRVAGISFDATCSLVLRDVEGAPLALDPKTPELDTIVWLDHRAVAEAEACTASGHRVLDFIGGVMSPEMQIPKLMWLKRRRPERWRQIGYAFDLADFLTWKASGNLARSACTLTCKWTHLRHEDEGWRADFLAQMGLDDLLERARLPRRAHPIGTDLGPLTDAAAAVLGLTTRCRVGTGLIDAHAGALGVLGGLQADDAARHVGLIAGTSSCIMALAPEPRQVRGVWGPYFEAALPGLWLHEGGQSATGALLDHVLRLHGQGGAATPDLHARVVARVQELRATEGDAFADRLHVLPDFHGNRSPLADPHAVGVISGLTLDASFDGLCRLYWRTAVGIALGVRHIIEALNEKGYRIDTLHVTGGHVKNPLLMELYADATGCTLIEPGVDDAVLQGTGMVAATAAGWAPDLATAARELVRPGRERRPDMSRRASYDRDYRTFLSMHEHRRALDRTT